MVVLEYSNSYGVNSSKNNIFIYISDPPCTFICCLLLISKLIYVNNYQTQIQKATANAYCKLVFNLMLLICVAAFVMAFSYLP